MTRVAQYPITRIEKNIIQSKLDEIQQAMAIVESFGYDFSNAKDDVRDIHDALVRMS